MFNTVRNIINLIVIVVFMMFVAVNSGQQVDVHFFVKTVKDVPFGMVVALSFMMGVLVSIPIIIAANLRFNKKLRDKIDENNKQHERIEQKRQQTLKKEAEKKTK